MSHPHEGFHFIASVARAYFPERYDDDAEEVILLLEDGASTTTRTEGTRFRLPFESRASGLPNTYVIRPETTLIPTTTSVASNCGLPKSVQSAL